jgi:pilus assembly protein CpaE
MDPIRVIVFENFPKFRKTINDLLKRIPEVTLVENDINNTDAALELIYAQKPDAIILGYDFPGNDGYYFTQLIRQEVPPTQVIIIADVASAESVRQAMRAGACDYLSYKKLSADELITGLEQAGRLAAEERKIKLKVKEKEEAPAIKSTKTSSKRTAKILTVYGPKGGVGTSTITANLACALASNNQKVLIVDGDMLFGDIDILLNQRSNHSISDLVRFKDSLDDDIIKDVINHGRVDLMTSPSSAEEAVEVTGPILEAVLPRLVKLGYDYLIINTTSHMADPTIIALEKADIIILIGTQEISSIRAIRMFMNLSRKIHLDTEHVFVVINKFEKNSTLTMAKLRKSLELEIATTISHDYETVLLANNLGRPFVLDNPNLPISREFTSMANMIGKGKIPGKPSKLIKTYRKIEDSFFSN